MVSDRKIRRINEICGVALELEETEYTYVHCSVCVCVGLFVCIKQPCKCIDMHVVRLGVWVWFVYIHIFSSLVHCESLETMSTPGTHILVCKYNL